MYVNKHNDHKKQNKVSADQKILSKNTIL